jgi:methyl-accepting chemotaxis protein
MSSYVENVATAVADTGDSVELVVRLARELDQLASAMNERVRSFTETLRAA